MGKTVLEQWLEVNDALYKCYKGVKPDEFEAMQKAEQDKLCSNERNAVTKMLNSNDLDFKTLAQERLSHLWYADIFKQLNKLINFINVN